MFHTTAPIKAIIADNYPLIRQGLKEILSGHPDIELLAEASDGIQLLELLKKYEPHVILIDIQMHRMDGVEVSRIIKEKYPAIEIITLSVSDEDRFIQELWHIGTKGHVLKDIDKEELIHAIKTVYSGGRYYCKEVINRINSLMGNRNAMRAKYPLKPTFSETEIRIIKLLCNGLTNKEIAASVGLAKKTVEHYKEKIHEKTGAKNSAQVAVYSIFNHIISRDNIS